MSKYIWLEKLAQIRELDKKKLKEEYTEILNELKRKHVTGDLETIAKHILMSRHRELRPFRRKRKYPLASFVGFKIGDLGLQDDAQRMRDWAKFIVERDGVEIAKQQGLVAEQDGSLVVLDTRPTIFGRPNKNHGKPLPPTLKLRRRDIILLAKQAEDEDFVFTRLQTRDNRLALAWDALPFHVPVAFTAAIQQQGPSYYLLSSSSAEQTRTIFRELKEKWDIFNIFKSWADESLTPIEDLIKYHEATQDAWDRWVLTKGIVANINVETETFRGFPCLLIDSEEGYEAEKSVLFYVPDHLKLTFGLYSEIYLLGKTRAIIAQDEETKRKYIADVVIDSWGFFPVPGKSTSPSLLEPEEEEEEEIKGFIPAE